jgi:hypothetical protein
MNTTSAPAGSELPGRAAAGLGRRVGSWWLHELRELVPPTLFFIVGFNLVVLTTNLILADYKVAFAGFIVATTAALVVGKAVLVANNLPLLRRYDRAPVIWPILYKTLFYWAVVFVVRLLEHFIRFWLVEHNAIGGGRFLRYVAANFSWHRFAAIQIWILVLFLVYVTASEFNELFGHGEFAARPVHAPVVRAAAEPAAADPRAGALGPPRRRASGRGFRRSDQRRPPTARRDCAPPRAQSPLPDPPPQAGEGQGGGEAPMQY